MPQLAPERTFEVERVYLQLKALDAISQTFRCHCYIEMRARGAQQDADFFKKDADGTLVNTMTKHDSSSVVPSVLWYLQNQMRWPNASEHEIVECKAIPTRGSSEDLSCIIRVNGEFQEEMELFHFPVDFQDLQLMFEMQCAKTVSPFPVQLVLSPNLVATIDHEAFMLRNIWSLEPSVVVDTFEHTGIGGSIVYPAVRIACRVSRLSSYYILNIVVPMGLFSFLSILAALAMPIDKSPERIGLALTLVLTAAAYKFAIASMVPTVSYTTLADKYILSQVRRLGWDGAHNESK